MDIIKKSIAGSLESNDLLVMVMPSTEFGIKIDIESIVMKQFGNAIKKTVEETLETLDIHQAHIRIQDRGAFDCTIRARVETAIKRATEEEELQ